jgi:hypothetical protein
MDLYLYRGKALPFGQVGQLARLSGPYKSQLEAARHAHPYEHPGFAVLMLTEEEAKLHNARTKKGL